MRIVRRGLQHGDRRLERERREALERDLGAARRSVPGEASRIRRPCVESRGLRRCIARRCRRRRSGERRDVPRRVERAHGIGICRARQDARIGIRGHCDGRKHVRRTVAIHSIPCHTDVIARCGPAQVDLTGSGRCGERRGCSRGRRIRLRGLRGGIRLRFRAAAAACEGRERRRPSDRHCRPSPMDQRVAHGVSRGFTDVRHTKSGI